MTPSPKIYDSPVTVEERREAKEIVEAFIKLGYRPGEISLVLGISRDYVSHIRYMSTRGFKDDDWSCPHWAIRRVIEWPKRNSTVCHDRVPEKA